jgi:hypothetical protein
MEDEKIISMKDQDLPIDRELLLKKLNDIPEDVKTNYVKVISSLLNDLLLWKNILTENSNVAKHILDGLDHSLLERFNTIVSNLILTDFQKSISNIVGETMNIENPTPESQEKAVALIDFIKSSNIDYDNAWKELVFTSRQLCHLASSILLLNMGKTFEGTLLDHLSRLPSSEFNGIFELCEEKLKRKIE